MVDLTARQVQILRAIVEEFISTAEPVGSEALDRKFNLGVSPATIRNDMVQLTKLGYLMKPHSSAGRQPTAAALKLYIRELMKEKDLSVADEVSLKERIWSERNDKDDLLREATKILADKCDAVGIAIDAGDKFIISAGYSHLLSMPEFYDIETMRHVLTLIEEFPLMHEIVVSTIDDNPVKLVFGADLGNKYLAPVSMLYIDFTLDDNLYQLGVLGCHRFDYQYVVPMLRYFRVLIQDMVKSE